MICGTRNSAAIDASPRLDRRGADMQHAAGRRSAGWPALGQLGLRRCEQRQRHRENDLPAPAASRFEGHDGGGNQDRQVEQAGPILVEGIEESLVVDIQQDGGDDRSVAKSARHFRSPRRKERPWRRTPPDRRYGSGSTPPQGIIVVPGQRVGRHTRHVQQLRRRTALHPPEIRVSASGSIRRSRIW